jgi:hypothetical protein
MSVITSIPHPSKSKTSSSTLEVFSNKTSGDKEDFPPRVPGWKRIKSLTTEVKEVPSATRKL